MNPSAVSLPVTYFLTLIWLYLIIWSLYASAPFLPKYFLTLPYRCNTHAFQELNLLLIDSKALRIDRFSSEKNSNINPKQATSLLNTDNNWRCQLPSLSRCQWDMTRCPGSLQCGKKEPFWAFLRSWNGSPSKSVQFGPCSRWLHNSSPSCLLLCQCSGKYI